MQATHAHLSFRSSSTAARLVSVCSCCSLSARMRGLFCSTAHGDKRQAGWLGRSLNWHALTSTISNT